MRMTPFTPWLLAGALGCGAFAADGPRPVEPLTTPPTELLAKHGLALSPEELAILEANGFVVRDGVAHGSHFEAYERIFFEDLPVLITEDLLLDAFHGFYQPLLERIGPALRDDLEVLTWRGQELAAGMEGFDQETREDVVHMLSLGNALLHPRHDHPLSQERDALFGGGFSTRLVFHTGPYDELNHPYQPRAWLQREGWWEALAWVGRAPADVSRRGVLDRRQLERALLFRALLDDPKIDAAWTRLDTALEVLVGPANGSDPRALDPVLEALGGVQGVREASDARVLAALEEHDVGQLTVRSGDWGNDSAVDSLPRRITILPQRDSAGGQVASRLTAPDVEDREMPDALDFADAVLGNPRAAVHRDHPFARKPDYRRALEAVRHRVDRPRGSVDTVAGHWLDALRAMRGDPETGPALFDSPAWLDLTMSSQLAGWIQLRHANEPFFAPAVRSYGCVYPDAWVEPDRPFLASLRRAVALVDQIATQQLREGWSDGRVETWLRVLDTLDAVVVDQEAGRPLQDDHLAFLNQMVRRTVGSNYGRPNRAFGWYAQLLDDPHERRVVTTSVLHNQRIGKHLVLGTGLPRQVVVAVQTPRGPGLFVGAVSRAYADILPEAPTDEDWAAHLQDEATRPDPFPWEAPFTATDAEPSAGSSDHAAGARIGDGWTVSVSHGDGRLRHHVIQNVLSCWTPGVREMVGEGDLAIRGQEATWTGAREADWTRCVDDGVRFDGQGAAEGTPTVLRFRRGDGSLPFVFVPADGSRGDPWSAPEPTITDPAIRDGLGEALAACPTADGAPIPRGTVAYLAGMPRALDLDPACTAAALEAHGLEQVPSWTVVARPW